MSEHESTVVKPGNKYINNYGWLPRQRLAEDLIIQAIKMAGMYISYVPREVFERDPLFGDDNWAKFEYAFDIEVYVKDVDGYQGQQELFSKFHIEQRDQITFTVSRRRWKESNEHKILDETGLPIEDESSPTWEPYSTVPITEQNGAGSDYSVESAYPKAGDLIYFPMVDKLFEILYVEHENLFYAHGTLLTYDLKCELFRYNNEEFDTGETAIDAFNELLSTDQMGSAITDEDSDPIEDENSEEIIAENAILTEKDPVADNKSLEENSNLIDYSEKSPFLQKDRW